MASQVLPSSGGIHPTLTGTTADTITGAGDEPNVEVLNRGIGWLYVRRDGSPAVAAASGTIAVPPGGWVRFPSTTSISVVGNGDAYSVTKVQ